MAITLSPTPVDAGKGDAVEATLRYLHGIGMPDSFGYTELEFTANILMFVPLGAFVAMALPRERYWAGLIGLPALSAVIELAQHTALAGRTGSLGDILANSLGAWLGLAAGAAVTSWNRRAMR